MCGIAFAWRPSRAAPQSRSTNMQISQPLPPTASTQFTLNDALRRQFDDQGYLKFDSVVDRAPLAHLTQRIRDEYDQARSSQQLFVGGGTTSGHLNCFPGAESRFVYDRLLRAGI